MNFKECDHVKQVWGYFHDFVGLVGVITHVNNEFEDEDNLAVCYDFADRYVVLMCPKKSLVKV